MTDIENHMVVNLDAELDRLYSSNEEKESEEYFLIKLESEKTIAGSGFFPFDEVLQTTYEYTSDPRHPELHDYADCVKEILSLYPDSKLARLVRHMSVVTAADALDIDL